MAISEDLPGGENLFDDGEPTRIEIRNEGGEVYYDPSSVEIEIGENVVVQWRQCSTYSYSKRWFFRPGILNHIKNGMT